MLLKSFLLYLQKKYFIQVHYTINFKCTTRYTSFTLYKFIFLNILNYFPVSKLLCFCSINVYNSISVSATNVISPTYVKSVESLQSLRHYRRYVAILLPESVTLYSATEWLPRQSASCREFPLALVMRNHYRRRTNHLLITGIICRRLRKITTLKIILDVRMKTIITGFKMLLSLNFLILLLRGGRKPWIQQ